MYSRRIFHFFDPADLPRFCQTILPHRLNAIQSLHIDWSRCIRRSNQNPHQFAPEELKIWGDVWDIVSKIQNLSEVRVELDFHRFDVTWERMVSFCRPMMGIKGLKRFELVVPWHDTTDWGFAQHAPFRVLIAAEPREIIDDLAMCRILSMITHHQERARLVH